jgi:hypothetical protein
MHMASQAGILLILLAGLVLRANHEDGFSQATEVRQLPNSPDRASMQTHAFRAGLCVRVHRSR